MEFKDRPREPFFSTQNLLKILIFTLLIFFSAVIQTSFFGATRFFSASPDLLLAAVIGIAIYDSERSAAAAGIGAGFLCEALGGAGTFFLPVLYLLIGYVIGIFSRVFLRRNFVSWIVVILACAGIKAVVGLLYLVCTTEHFNFIVAVVHSLAPEFILTVLFSIPMMFLTRVCARPFHKQSELE